MMTTRLIYVFALAVVASCASSGSNTSGDDRQSRPPTRSANLLTADELAASSAQDVYRAVELLRPTWLRTRGTSSTTASRGVAETVQVYLDNSHYGQVGSLRQLTVTSVRELRYIDGGEATTRFGTGHGAGAILVRLK